MSDMTDAVQGWERARDALQGQVDLMKRDPVFPDHKLTEAQRNDVRSSLELMITRFDELIIKYGARR